MRYELLIPFYQKLMASPLVTGISFPFAPLGMCFDGVRDLAPLYFGHDVKFAYNVEPTPGHVWLLVDGTPVDTYYGVMTRTYEWMNPQYVVNSFYELEQLKNRLTGKKIQ